jgi:thymidine kinase
MSAGKSTELIRRIERARLAYLPVVTFKPVTDNRVKESVVASRNGLTAQAIVVKDAREILNYANQAVVIGIDECQFFGDELVDVIQALLRQKKKIIASGLDLDYLGKPFGPVPQLLALADRIDKLLAVCKMCGSDFACRTQRLVQSSQQILIGDEVYEARCLNCFEPSQEHQMHISLSDAQNAQPDDAEESSSHYFTNNSSINVTAT